jgi:anti-sigma regulatory factor (Ser/Thr protein kinase)
MSTALELVPEPRSVRRARAWVVGELETIGRSDLADAAELGVSELVTNAILHANPPIVVRLGGTHAHPRVEVHDSSVAPPSLKDMTGAAALMATVGRGLAIVEMYSTTWGAEVSADGKVVWFEPAADAEANVHQRHRPGDLFDLEDTVEGLLAATGEPGERLTITLLGMPIRVFAHYRVWYDELRRELRLLALTHGDDYPVSQEISELTLRVEQERRQARGVDQLDEALRSGLDRMDLHYDVPTSAPATMQRLRELLEEVDVFCREQRLLTSEPTRQQVQLRNWYLGEFERQGRGEAPVPWPGSYVVESAPA